MHLVATPQPRRIRLGWSLAALVVGAVVLSAPAAVALWLTTRDGGEASRVTALSPAAFEDQTGVRIVRIATAGGGGIVDLRFQVLDPDKALAVHDKQRPLTLVDEENGAVLRAAFHGRHSGGTTQVGLNAGATYYLLFANPGGALQRGDLASVEVDGGRLEHVRVR
jgi:hypothetical protein